MAFGRHRSDTEVKEVDPEIFRGLLESACRLKQDVEERRNDDMFVLLVGQIYAALLIRYPTERMPREDLELCAIERAESLLARLKKR